MATPGKSKRPPPLRDTRIDSTPPVPRPEALGHVSPRVLRPARPEAPEGQAVPIVALESDVARLRAERASDADELGAMLVRVAASERAREAAEARATGLEKWAEELEAKVAEARTRGDELEAELARVGREHVEALEVERVRRGFELKAAATRHRAEAGASGGVEASSDVATARETVGQIIATLEELERHESQSALARARAFEQAREFLATRAVRPSRPPVTNDVPTVPPTRAPSTRPRRPPELAPAAEPSIEARAVTTPPGATPVAKAAAEPQVEMVTFEDLDLGD
jgi:hypothetical protein